jgi:group I intron endonuclease
MNFYVYLIQNNITKKKYIGSRMAYKGEDPLNDKYMGSSKHLNEDYKVYGIENFSKEILQSNYTDKIEMIKGESFYMRQYNTFEPNGYNRYDPADRIGFHVGGCKKSEQSKEKQSKSSAGNSPWNKGKKGLQHHSEKTKEQISTNTKGENNHNFGKTFAPEKNPMFGKTGENHPCFGTKRKRVICEYCKKEIPTNIYSLCHGDKCKSKKIAI